MTPKEKAKDLVNKFFNELQMYSNTKECALICIDGIIKSSPTCVYDDGSYFETMQDRIDSSVEYWKEVKQEIKLL